MLKSLSWFWVPWGFEKGRQNQPPNTCFIEPILDIFASEEIVPQHENFYPKDPTPNLENRNGQAQKVLPPLDSQ